MGAFLFYRGTEGKSSLLVVSCILSLSVVGLAERLKHHENQRDVKGTIAYVDASHGERFSPESWNDNAVLGLHLNLMRNGYQSFTLWDFDEHTLKQAQLLVVIAPSQPFSTQEIAWIKDFVQQGGMLFLSVGWEEKEASLPLMAALGFSNDYLPLAQFMSVIQPAGQKVRFFEAWPVMST